MDSINPQFKEHNGSLNHKKDLTNRFCRRPFELLEIHKEFYAFSCCPSWLPVIVGNCDHTSIEEVWNNDKIKEIRRSILDGDFKYCDQLECPEIQANRLPYKNEEKKYADVIRNRLVKLNQPPREIALCYDETCNLACPSCRNHKIQHSQGKTFEMLSQFTDKILSFLNIYSGQHPILLRVTGSGDPIASPVFLKLLRSLDSAKHSNLEVCLQTNGVMLTEKVWSSFQNIWKLIKSISISIDAATEGTYEQVRKFGHWKQLQTNLKFLNEKRKEGQIKDLSFNFVVQQKNYSEMIDFVIMAKELGNVDKVFFSFVNDWDTWTKEEYEKQCIWKSDHPEFQNMLQSLRHEKLSDPIVHLGNLTEYRKKALEN